MANEWEKEEAKTKCKKKHLRRYLSDFFVFKVLRFGSYVVNAYINFLASYLIVASTGEGSLLTAKQKLTITKFNKV